MSELAVKRSKVVEGADTMADRAKDAQGAVAVPTQVDKVAERGDGNRVVVLLRAGGNDGIGRGCVTKPGPARRAA